jgi:hypothetical protein
MDNANSSGQKSKSQHAWIWAIVAPFVVCFVLGGWLGWHEIEKDSGRILRDTGRQVTQQDYYQSAVPLGFCFGLAGAAMGGIGLGCAFITNKRKHD